MTARRAAALILCGMLAVCGFFSAGRISCEAKEPAAKQEKDTNAGITQKKAAGNDAVQEVIAFVTSYYEAQTPEGIDTLADYVDDPLSWDFQRDLIGLRTFYQHGALSRENIKVTALPMSDGKHWVAAVSADLIVEGFDVGIPGLQVLLVGRNEKGKLELASYAYDFDTYSDSFIKEMRELSLSDEIVERSNEIAMAYNELIAERPDIMDWLLETQEAMDDAVRESIIQKEALLAKADSEEEDQEENTEEKPDTKSGSYTVQKGDCLWDIAEKQLGDGMRWSGLYEKNKDAIGENPDLLYVGIMLQLKSE